MKTKIEIKSIWGKLLFEFEKEDNSIKDALIEAIIRGADLQGAYLQGAYLQGTDLRGADLQGADLQGADLQGADLRGVYLQGTDLQGTDLRGANLQGADLRGADLQGANLQGADLRGVYLQGAKGKELSDLKKYFWIIPEEGSFIAWKKCRNAIVKLEIPLKAKRTSNLLNRKCRAEFVKVLQIWDLKGNEIDKAIGMYNPEIIYRVGKITKPDKYNDDFTKDCSNGIHFFLTRGEAEEFNM